MKYSDIRFVKRLVSDDGTTYEWFVAHKSCRVSDCRCYVNEEEGKTVIATFPVHWLPKRIQKFIAEHEETLFEEYDDGFKVYIIK